MKVVQCWDDGVNNDIRLTDILRKYNAKATFNLNPGLMTNERIAPYWMKAGEPGWSYKGYRNGHLALQDIKEVYDGFQLASHCWMHENAGTTPDDEWIKSALDARHFLEDIVQHDCPGFAYPCGVYTEASCRLLRENGFAYGRTVEKADDVTKCKDPMALAANCHIHDTPFWEKYRNAKQNGHKAFYFWGHSYEMLDCESLWRQFEETIRYISEDPDTEWANVEDIAPLVGK